MSSYTAHNDQPSSTSFQIYSHGVTDTGHVRTRNEDSILVHDDENVWIVADGMGGHHAGDFASQTITNNLSLFKQHASLDDSILLLEENILNSNAIIRKKQIMVLCYNHIPTRIMNKDLHREQHRIIYQPLTGLGVGLVIVDPSPSWKELLSPQQ